MEIRTGEAIVAPLEARFASGDVQLDDHISLSPSLSLSLPLFVNDPKIVSSPI